MQTLQQNQGKKPLVMYLLGSLNCGSLGSGFGNQYSKGIRQTPGGVWTDGTRGTTTLHPMPHTDFSVESTRGGGVRGGGGVRSSGRRDGWLSKVSSGKPTTTTTTTQG